MKKPIIYLDNAATTAVDVLVAMAMQPYLDQIYGNPSSFNDAGRAARKAVDEARRSIVRFLGAKSDEIIFTGSGTEGNNLAIFGLLNAIQKSPALKFQSSNGNNKKNLHIITTVIEHHSVLYPIQQLEKDRMCAVTYLPVDHYGMIKAADLQNALRPETVLVSIIYANNEIGTLQPIKRISKIIQQFRNSQPLATSQEPAVRGRIPFFHIDACQAVGYADVNVNNLSVDLMTINASKIHGPKGVGVLYIRRGTPIAPLLYGGGQEYNLRSGTENVPGIVGFARAIELIAKSVERKVQSNSEKLRDLKFYFIAGVKKILPQARFNGHPQESAPHIISVTIPGVESETLLLLLDEYGIYASSGAACAAKDMDPSHVLRAIGLSKKDARSTLRFSLSRLTTQKDLEYVLRALPQIVARLKKIYPPRLLEKYYS